jgi:two-component system, chemotaxis family, protein-glutamate methylesterase/glutaminase
MTKVFVIDDSALTRSVLQSIINADPSMTVVGTAIDPIIAAKKIHLSKPDVITLDLEMPRMDGLTFLRRLMENSPCPVVVISGRSPRASKNAIQALEYGAVEIIEKPDLSTPEKLADVSDIIREAIRSAAGATLRKNKSNDSSYVAPIVRSGVAKNQSGGFRSTKICVIGSSTGGPDALREIFQSIDNEIPGCVVAQHMPGNFTGSFAERLNGLSKLTIKEAKGGELIKNNQVLIIPGNFHGVIRKCTQGYYLELNQEEKVNRHRPSVDVLFSSVADVAGADAFGVLLTGMGDDGARGLLKMRQAGAFTIAQDAASCVVFGMPKRAIELNAAIEVLSTDDIIKRINSYKA